MNARTLKIAAKAVSFIGLVNFIAFLTGAWILGGDAISGHVAGGHYFVGYQRHFEEVSRGAFVYSWWYTVSLFVTTALAIAADLIYRFRSAKPPGNSR